MTTRTIQLDGEPLANPDGDQVGWWYDDRIVTVREESFVTAYKLPKTSVVTLLRFGDGRARLGLGGFTKTTVSLIGPREHLERLREACL